MCHQNQKVEELRLISKPGSQAILTRRFFVASLESPRQTLRHRRATSSFYILPNSLFIRTINATEYELATTSLNKPHENKQAYIPRTLNFSFRALSINN